MRVGDAGVWVGAPLELPNGRLLSKALDNRLGAYIALEAARRIAEAGEAQVDVVAVAAVQEEIGLYGARTAAYGLDPQVAIAIDVTPATDYPRRRSAARGNDRARHGRDDRARPDAEQARHRSPRRGGRGGGDRARLEVYARTTSTDADEIHLTRAGDPDGARSRSRRATCTARPRSATLADVEAIVRLIVAFAKRLSRDQSFAALMAGRSVIVSAVRTPFGKLGGGLAGYKATELGALVIKAALERIGLEPHEPQYVIMGQVLQAGAGQAPARQAAIGAGLPKETPADTINKVCASSIRAIEIADSMIRAGDVDVVVTGGMESMSNAPYLLKKARFGYRLGDGELIDSMVYDGLTSTFDGLHMVEQNSQVARELGIRREEQDAWAARSHERAARRAGRGPLRRRDRSGRRGHGRRGDPARHDAREARGAEAGVRPRGDDHRGQRARRQRRRQLRDRLLARSGRAKRGLEPLATILAQGYVADDFAYLARTPANAAAMALERAGKTIDDVSRVEINEAFASVASQLDQAARRRRGAA